MSKMMDEIAEPTIYIHITLSISEAMCVNSSCEVHAKMLVFQARVYSADRMISAAFSPSSADLRPISADFFSIFLAGMFVGAILFNLTTVFSKFMVLAYLRTFS